MKDKALGTRTKARRITASEQERKRYMEQMGGSYVSKGAVSIASKRRSKTFSCALLTHEQLKLKSTIAMDCGWTVSKPKLLKNGGETGIRTLDTLSSIHAFQACAFSHSAISPWEDWLGSVGKLRRSLIVTYDVILFRGWSASCKKNWRALRSPTFLAVASRKAGLADSTCHGND